MSEQHFRAVFLLANMPFTDVFPIQNGYCSRDCCQDRPWFLFRTEHGLIKIGWRKRVIAIDWSDTGLRKVISKDDVTMSTYDIHAWGYGKAVTYLSILNDELLIFRRDELRKQEVIATGGMP